MSEIRREVTWTALKSVLTSKGIAAQYAEDTESYLVLAIDGPLVFQTTLLKSNKNADLLEFEATYKPVANTSLTQLDTDGAAIVRNKAAKKGWTFCSLPIEFTSSRLQTGNLSASDDMYSKDIAGTTRSFITQKVYDADDVEITSPGLANINLAAAVKTVIDFEPPHDYEVIGGELRTLTTITANMRLWLVAAPDIAAPAGSKEMGGGINLKYLAPGNVWSVDGRVTKYATYIPGAHTNKIRLTFKHDPGTAEALQIVIQLYKA